MKINRKLLGAAAFSAALAGGGAAGALLGTPGLSGAQDDTETTTTETDAVEHRGPGGFHDGELLAAAAEALGVTEDELRTALEDGQSIADVAEAQGVDLQTVIDALVAQATERLEEIEAALPERMEELVNKEGWGDGPRGRRHHLLEAGIDVAAEAIGITEQELVEQLRDGSTIAEVAEANGVDVQTVIDALVAAATERIDAAVESGDLDADRAEELKANLVERVTDRVNHEGFPHRPFRGAPGESLPEDTADDAS